MTGADPRLRKRDWAVAGCDLQIASRLIAAEHYAKGASNTATYLHGLYPAGWHWYEECVGIAWWIPPTRSAAEAWAGEGWQGVLALSRLAVAPHVPKNACSFLLSRSAKMIDRTRWHTLVTYADSWRGHTGAIYKACGWEYAGQTAPEAVYTLNGRMVARKAGPKTRTHAEMLALGAVFEGRFPKARFCLRADQGSRKGRPKEDKAPMHAKLLWEASCEDSNSKAEETGCTNTQNVSLSVP